MDTGAVLDKRLTVGARGVTSVAFPPILGILLVESVHQTVAIVFGKDGGGRYGEVLCIATHNALVWSKGVGRKAVPVH